MTEGDGWTDTMVEVATYLAVQAARARISASETTLIEECSGPGRTCQEVRALAEAQLREWQAIDGAASSADARN
ncbi:MAG: hypothetical protein K2X54_08305 [Methylobacterium organophilum]|nr:hypothetical protein [Methylobacterium organophilum]